MKKIDIRQFDYQKVATFDSEMWRAYYNHQFFKLFLLLVKLLKSQFGFSWFTTIKLAYYSAWAAAYYRIRKHKGVNNDRIVKNLTSFYALIAKRCTVEFDYKKAAELELAWWDIHRSSYENNDALEQSLADGAAAIYNIPATKLAEYAHFRAEAMILPRHNGDNQAEPIDWPKITELLVIAWGALYREAQD